MLGRLARAGVEDSIPLSERKPDWIRPHVKHGEEVLNLKKTLRDLSLVTVCEEAGCPNLSECWNDGTATFMVLGERSLEEEKKALSSDIKDIFAEAKSAGFDVKVLRAVIRLRKQEPAEVEEQETLLDLYRRALGM
jgi:uncharacterized protein (UPF0335 family)